LSRIRGSLITFSLLAAVGAGCSTGQGAPDPEAALQSELAERRQELQSLQATVRQNEQALEQRDSQISSLTSQLERARIDVAGAPPSATSGDLLPPAVPGQCFARLFVPPQFETASVRVLKREAGERLEIIPAKYEWAEERVLVKEATERIEVVPAVYDWAEERVLVSPAQTVWKKGRGPIERVDNATGEIMCLVESPAKYKTVRKRVLTTPPTTRTVTIPAEYKTVKVRKVVQPAQTRTVTIPEEYTTVRQTNQVSDGSVEWRPILCETNFSRGLVSDLQRALRAAGHNPGPIDGRVGRKTLAAVASFQRAKGLARGGLTLATLDALGIKVGQ
jgi:hypothetical protein